ncbi:MAG: hydantoinase B/oxoprolinase family protein [Proteobacteria bacterium]|nr:hydantoinase B/oxoprolinase family protein [Pseudomonadota bacterium]MDA1356922.1 hydantoinase B/oxoprolinase family protein [Pseudomonadota bacterium]
MTARGKQLDAISLGIMWDRLISITDEIVSTLVRTSFSTIVREAYDLTAVVTDAEGHLLAQGRWSAPPFIGTAPLTMAHTMAKFPPHTLKPGDVLATNDPWIGTGHMYDITVMRPVFRGEKLVGYTMSITHLPDVGGTGFGTMATEIYHEGLRLPLCKLVREGEVDQFILDLIAVNVRVPEQVIGDVMANVACNEVGGRQLLEFMEEYDLDDLSELSGAIRDQSERMTRAAILNIRDGTYRNSIRIEGIDEAIILACRVDVEGDSVRIDMDGTDAAVQRGINVPYCYTNAMSLYSMKCLTVPSLPNNEGSTKPIHVSAPKGCILNAQPPSPTGGRHIIGHFVSPLIFGALAEAAPQDVQADTGMIDLMNFVGTHKDGRGVSTIYFAAGGFGALDGHDGPATVPGPSNMAVVPTEVWEGVTSTLVERRALLPDSGGAGAARGGLGQEIIIRNDSGHPMTVFSMANRSEFPPMGLLGGGNGPLREHLVNGKTVHPKGQQVLAPGDRVALRQPGGGGFGPAKDRPRDKILADIRNGYVTREGAKRDYGFEEKE